MGYEIKFLFRTDDPISVKGKDAIVKGLTEAGFKATPVPTTTANYVDGARQHQRGHQRPLRRLVLRLAVRLRPGSRRCSGRPTWTRPTRSAPTTRRSATRRSTTRSTRSSSCRWTQQAAAWNDLDKEIADEVLPAVPDLLHRRRSGPRIEDQGRLRRQHARHADLEGHLGQRSDPSGRLVGHLTGQSHPGGGVRRTPYPTDPPPHHNR